MMNRQQVTLDNFGSLKLFSTRHGYYWFGCVENISPDNNQVELTIHVDDKNQSLTNQTKLLTDFANNYNNIMNLLYDHMSISFTKTCAPKTIEDLREMYFLSSVELKMDNKDWWIVFEPAFEVETNYNFLPRFTVKDMLVTWSNLK